jgi:hypothetical protein
MDTPLTAHTCSSSSAEIIPSVSIASFLAQRNAAVERLRSIRTAVEELDALAQAFGLHESGREHMHHQFLRPLADTRYGALRFTEEGWFTQATAQVDAALWNLLLHRSGLRTFMDAKARDQWDEEIEKVRTPPLTTDNIRATFAQLHASRGEFFERGVLQVFRSLSWDYRSNLPRRFGTRIILRHVVSSWGYPASERCDPLDVLLRAFNLLDGKPEPDHRHGMAARLRARPKGEDLVDEYVRIRTFKNGNAHVFFLKPRLIDELNRILARHHPLALPPADV